MNPFHLSIPLENLAISRKFYKEVLECTEGRSSEKWVDFNRKYSEVWPVIITKKDQLPGAEERDGEEGKLKKYFSEVAGSGG